MPGELTRQSTRMAVDWEVPGTMIGDGGPYRGTVFIDADTPLSAWDIIARATRGGQQVVRAYPAEDVCEVHAAARARGEWA